MRLSGICDIWLHHDLPIAHPIDDSVVRSIGGRRVSIRLARGLAPLALDLPEFPPAMAVGGYLKSAIAWSNGRQMVLGPHLGDQQTVAARERFVSAVEQSKRLYDFQPETLVHDLYPDYYSTDYARSSGLPTVTIQHHHAHIVAGMLEHGWLDREVLGIAWDGTGFGTDGTIWGGEFLLCRAESFQRVGHLRPFRLPGGEAAIQEPWRIAIALVNDLADRVDHERFLEDLSSDERIDSRRLEMIQKLSRSERLSPVTTSAGRLFDAAASIILHFYLLPT
jgi:hydrogenase maturation protein HypF